jgi:hypothetical protein
LQLERLLPQFPLLIQNQALAFQLSPQLLLKDLPYGKIIEILFTTQSPEMVPGFPAPIPGIMVLTSAPIFLAAFDLCFLKIIHESPAIITHDGFQHAGFSEKKRYVPYAVCCFFGGGISIF